MIYITQLIFVKKGKENEFLEFENHVIPLMEKYNGKVLYRIRPSAENYVDLIEKMPFEIHFISFNSENELGQFMKDDDRLNFIHLKDESVESILLVKGEEI